MPVKDLVAINSITHKPKTKVEHVAPGETFTPASEEDREFFLKSKAARELTEAEAGAPKKKAAPAKKKAAETAAPAEDKAIPMDSAPGEVSNAADDDMLD